MFILLVISLHAAPVSGQTDVQAASLPIRSLYQETEVWCWAAVSEMVFRYYGVPAVNPDYQCGIVGGLGGQCATNCYSCVFSAGQMSNLVAVMEGYPRFVSQYNGRPSTEIDVTPLFRPLSFNELRAEIDASRPVVAAISPSGMSTSTPEHVSLVVGHQDDGGGDPIIYVNDPFPFAILGHDPYVAAGGTQLQTGGYAIRYGAFVTLLQWTESVWQIQALPATSSSETFPPYCCTPSGRYGPYPNDSIREGENCFVYDAWGNIGAYGVACNYTPQPANPRPTYEDTTSDDPGCCAVVGGQASNSGLAGLLLLLGLATRRSRR